MNKECFGYEFSFALLSSVGFAGPYGKKICRLEKRVLPVGVAGICAVGTTDRTANKGLKIQFVAVFLLLCGIAFPSHVAAQQTGIKTNLLYWATTTPNMGLEFRLASRYTLSVTVGYNAFNFPNSNSSGSTAVNPKLHHWLVMPESKYWFCKAFERHYIGLHALYGQYNAGGMKFPKFLKSGRYDGWAAGAGLSYGYQWAIGKRWGLEASVGAGYIYLRYGKYKCGACGKKEGNYRHHYFVPTKAALSFIYYIR